MGLLKRLQEAGYRATVLDGDDFRSRICPELGFSPSDRSANLKRAKIVATEIVRQGGIVICSFIAPYERDRLDFRESIKQVGKFFLVHVSTPLGECERRDPKGLYAKAKSGMIRNFTGVSDVYEVPEACEARINTTNMTIDEAVMPVIRQLVLRDVLSGIRLVRGGIRVRTSAALQTDGNPDQLDSEAHEARLFQVVLHLLVSQPRSIGEAASTLKTSQRTIERAVKWGTGMSYRDLRRELMLDKAKSLLDKGQSIKDVAFSLGFGTPQGFHRFFLRGTGMTPGCYRVRRSVAFGS